ncbi:MAG: dockerin type I repeat-containing protein [Ruminococcus sp.]|nr:dockerin type I repeat-containing protein [Ruminococcus sp.]
MKKQSKRIITAVIATVLSAVGMIGMTVSADVADNSIMGDANADGRFTIADVALFQSWIMGNDVTLNNYQAVDFCEDGILDVFDLCMMKSELLTYNSSEEYPVKNPVVIDEFTPCTAKITDFFDSSGINIEIKHQYSVSDRIWTIEDFKGIDNIKSVSQDDCSNGNYTLSLLGQKPYRQIVTIKLENRSKENVLKMVQDIEALNLSEIKEIRVFKYGTGALPMTPEEWEEYVNSIR